MHKPIIHVIIPVFNEEKSIGLVLADIPKDWVQEVIVCNNGSSDNTAEVALAAGATVVYQPNKGYGNACLKGMEYIQQKPTAEQPDILVFLDGDYSDYPEELPLLIEPIIVQGIDLVIGSRLSSGKAEKGSLTPQQVFGNWLATFLIRHLYNYQFTDLGPFRAIRWSSLLQLKMVDRNYGWTVEMQIKAAKQKLRCTEIGVRYRKRVGVSKVSGTVKGTILAGYKILYTIFKYL
ncbi:MAG TPA: glycosyltransferase family 2 protein [Haliscomenobacter sp.]|uniref:glycosyltransferase family 2 protein n=1 Tax=Haliscomenobacter sp. TaxID=2717303 RepID=UPI002BCAF148|nr:glycosyltransferase family 2 protein [Haliscomenobacter sp.]HOY20254.1 glycosyltransferase family 2 protein [Haliscomenobacter sp.]